METNKYPRDHFEEIVRSLDEVFKRHSHVLTDKIQNAILGTIFVGIAPELWPGVDLSVAESIVPNSSNEVELFYNTFGWVRTKESSNVHADNARLALAFIAEELGNKKELIDDLGLRQSYLQWTQTWKAKSILQPETGTVILNFTHPIFTVAELQVRKYSSDKNEDWEKVIVISGLDQEFCDDLIELRKFWSGGTKRKSVPMACGTFGYSRAGQGGKGGWSTAYEAFSAAKGFDSRFQKLGIPIQGLQMTFKDINWDYS